MNTQNKTATLLFNPFYYIAGARALLTGLAAMAAAALIGSWSNAHFDGVLDTHVGAAAPLWLFLAEGLVDWLCLALAIWVAGKIISRTAFRTLDVLGTQALARWPTLLISLVVLPKAFQRFTVELVEQLKQGKFQFSTADGVVFILITLAMIPLLCWMVALMYRSFSVACNVKGGKAIGVFVAALLVAEIASKVCLVPVIQFALAHPTADVQATATAPAGKAGNVAGDIAASGGRFVDLLAKGDFARAVPGFDDTMKRVMPEERLRTVWQDLEKQVGSFQKQLGTRITAQQGYQIALVTCQFEHTNLDVKVVFDGKGQVAGLFYVPTVAASATQTN